MTSTQHRSVLIIGAGFSGIAMGNALLGARITDFVMLDRAQDVGGTWTSNTYPGCTCDIQSNLYSLSFAPNPDWSATYSPQPEIQRYLADCLDRFGLRPHLRSGVAVEGAAWDDAAQQWRVTTDQGEWTARVLISAVGPLTEPRLPDVPGIEAFQGTIMHSARWDADHDLTGERVASIGTGASAIQYVPRIADQVGELFVFQRSAPWIIPHDKRPTTAQEREKYRRRPWTQKLDRARTYVAREKLATGFVKDPARQETLAGVATTHMESQVADPELRRLLTPDFTIGCKRVVPSNEYYPALQRPGVTLVPHALTEIREHSVVGADGVEREVDTIVLATGYHVADVPFADKVRGRGGELLTDHWQGTPRAYLGATVPGFPNYFMFLGPNTTLGHSSMVFMIESQVRHVLKAIRTLRASGAGSIEVTEQAHDDYNAKLDTKLSATVWQTGGCTTWYHNPDGHNAASYPDRTFMFRLDNLRWRRGAYRLAAEAPIRPQSAGAPATRL